MPTPLEGGLKWFCNQMASHVNANCLQSDLVGFHHALDDEHAT